MMRLGSRATSFVPMRAPMISPTSWNGLDRGGREATGPLVEVEHLLVEQRGERDEADDRRRQERQAVPDPPEGLDLPHHAPALGEATAATSSVLMTSSSAPIARRSCAPRIGSRSRKARTTNTNVGMAKTMKGTRQLNQ